MSNAASNYLEERVLDFFLKNNAQSTSSPSTVFVGLFNTDDSSGATDELLEAGTLTHECQGGGYQRKAVTFGTISGGSVSNSGAITFPTATDGNWGTITHVAILDAEAQAKDNDSAGAGNVLFYGALTTAKTIESGDTFEIQANNLTVTLT